jgi:hypothetical protein
MFFPFRSFAALAAVRHRFPVLATYAYALSLPFPFVRYRIMALPAAVPLAPADVNN